MHPNLSKRAGTEEVWQSVMTADLKQGIWEVTSKPSADGIGGALFIYIAKSDARVVGIVLTQ